MSKNIKRMYYLYDYETGELIAEFSNKREYEREWHRREAAGQDCFGQDTESLLHNLAIELYGGDKMYGLPDHN